MSHQAQKTAEDWLALVDSRDYEKAWEAAHDVIKTSMKKPDWVRLLESVRTPLGALGTRSLSSVEERNSMPGFPDGSYVIFSFDSQLANKDKGAETVTCALSDGSDWHVVGYQVS